MSLLEHLSEKYDFGIEPKHHHMNALELINWIVEQTQHEKSEVVYQFYKYWGWSDRMAKVKTSEFLDGGYLW